MAVQHVCGEVDQSLVLGLHKTSIGYELAHAWEPPRLGKMCEDGRARQTPFTNGELKVLGR